MTDFVGTTKINKADIWPVIRNCKECGMTDFRIN